MSGSVEDRSKETGWKTILIEALDKSVICQWVMAVTIVLVPTYLSIGTVGYRPLVVLIVVVAIAGAFSGIARSLTKKYENRAECGAELNNLIDVATRYARQAGARRLQRPWLIASIMAYVLALLVLVWKENAPFSTWFQIVSTMLVAFGCMLRAGNLAGDDPPAGAGKLIELLEEYEPALRDSHSKLMNNIRSSEWRVDDAVKFLSEECAHYRRKALHRGIMKAQS